MLDRIISFSLRNRLVVLAVALLLLIVGTWQMLQLPIDVFPDLNRPRVVVITEAPGMAPEEVESLITIPLETALNGASGVLAVRSSSGSGISIINVEFDWNTDIYNDRQVVNERLQLASGTLPEGMNPTLAPVSSIMGQISMYGMWSEGQRTSSLDLRTFADWDVRQRLLAIPGVSQVFTMGGGRKQFQVLIDPDALREFGISVHEVHEAVQAANMNATGGYLDQRGANEILVRGIGRVTTLRDLESVSVAFRGGRTITLSQIASVVEAPQVKRGDSAAFVRTESGRLAGGESVVLTINKQPGADTRMVDAEIGRAVQDLLQTLPQDIRIAKVYSQRAFIDRAIANVIEALADGGALVVVILFLFLLNFRTTLVTLTAIPLSIVATACVFAWFGLSINTMTLGGLAVAIGELVDDAIVDVENIFRRLRENRVKGEPLSPLRVIWDASVEIRSSIVFGTAIVVLVFLPLFALEGMAGRVFIPLATAYVVSLLASLLVSLTVTPALSSLLLIGRSGWSVAAPFLSLAISALLFLWLIPRFIGVSGLPGGPMFCTIAATPLVWLIILAVDRRFSVEHSDGILLRSLKGTASWTIALSTRIPGVVLAISAGMVVVAVLALLRLERGFLPAFNEGSIQVNAVLAPGTSLATSNQIGMAVERRLLELDAVKTVVRRTGRAELDEHAAGVNISELVLEIDPSVDRGETIEQVRQAVKEIPGVVSNTEQPIQHLISHMISGVKADIGIKLFGDDLGVLRRTARELELAIADVEGLEELQVEQQTEIPQLRIELNREALAINGLRPADVMELVETAMNGKVVSSVLLGQRNFDLVLRLDDRFREDESTLRRLAINLPGGGVVPLESVANIYESVGPNTINREQVRRRIVLQANVNGRGIVDVVEEIKKRLEGVKLPSGYFLEYGGQFESEQSANQRLLFLTAIALIGMFCVLFTLFGNANFSLQVMVAIPAALVGGIAALYLTGQFMTVAATVGFISLCGIASRNGILLLNHYLHLMQHEGEGLTREMVSRAGQERLAPVLMTALTSGIGLLPLALAADEPGKELLYPIATVIIGGLITSTLAEFFVRPALFWKVGKGAAMQILEQRRLSAGSGQTF